MSLFDYEGRVNESLRSCYNGRFEINGTGDSRGPVTGLVFLCFEEILGFPPYLVPLAFDGVDEAD